jgi:hypothetical protein
VVIEDFAIEGYNGVTVGAPHRLITAFDIHDAQPSSAQRDLRRGKTPLLVGPAMNQCRYSGL